MGQPLRRCVKCKVEKESGEFSPDKRTRDGCQAKCKSCASDEAFERRQRDPDTTNAIARKSYHKRKDTSKFNTSTRRSAVKRQYGITLEEYDFRISLGCGICGELTDSMHLDHDHQTGAVRGALCREHNIGLGYFKDDPEMLEKAAAYLRSFYYDEV